jgi:hypothetical protein
VRAEVEGSSDLIGNATLSAGLEPRGRTTLLSNSRLGGGGIVRREVDDDDAGENVPGDGDIEIAFPGGDHDRRDAIADQIARRPRHANEPVDREHQDEPDRGDRGDRVQGRREDDDRRSRHAVSPL